MMRPSRTFLNSALDEPLSWWRMSGLDTLTFGEFVEALARSPAKVAGVASGGGRQGCSSSSGGRWSCSAPNGGRQSCSAPQDAEAGA